MTDIVERFTLVSPIDIPKWLREDMGGCISSTIIGGRTIEFSFDLRNHNVTLQYGDTIEKIGPDSYRINRIDGEVEQVWINPTAEYLERYHPWLYR